MRSAQQLRSRESSGGVNYLEEDDEAEPSDVLEDDDSADDVVTVTAGDVIAVPSSRGLTIAGVFPHLPPVPRFAPNLGLVRRQT